AESGLRLVGLNLELDPAHPGELRIDELRIPGGPDLKNVTAKTSYVSRDLEFRDLVLDPNLRFRQFGLDASQLAREVLALKLDADAFGGQLTGAVRLQNFGKPPLAHVELDVNNWSLTALQNFLNVGPALGGQLTQTTVRFDGQSDKPRTWTGRIETHLEKPAAGPAALDRVDFRVALGDGKAEVLTLEIVAGPSRFALTAQGDLPENIADLSRSPAQGTITLAAPDLRALPIALPPALGLRGALRASGPFTLINGRLSSEMTGQATQLVTSQPAASVREANFKATLAKTLPADATAPAPAPNTPPPPTPPFWDGLTTQISASLNELAFENFRFDRVELSARNDNAAVRVERLDVTRGANAIHVAAAYTLPAHPGQWQAQPLNVDLAVNAPDLAAFSTDPQAEPLAGKLSAQGHVVTVNGEWQGGVDIQGRDILARGLTLRTADAQIGLANDTATITVGHVQFDEKNSLDVGGQMALAAPYSFTGKLTLNLPDLGVFNPVLRANGLDKTVAGALQANADLTGRLETAPGANDAQLDGTIIAAGRNLLAAGARVADLDARIVAHNGRAVIETGAVRFDEKNAVGINGEFALAGTRAFDLGVNADLPNLAAFEPALRANGFKQTVAGAARLQTHLRGELNAAPAHPDGKPGVRLNDGQIVVNASELRAGGARALQTLDGRVQIENGAARIENFVVKFDDKNTLTVSGQSDTMAPFNYQTSVEANLTDLRSFEPLLRVFVPSTQTTASAKTPAPTLGEPAVKKKPAAPPPKATTAAPAGAHNSNNETRLAGAVQLRFQSRGQLASASAADAPSAANSALDGNLTVIARGVEFNALGPLDADVAGGFTPTTADFQTLSFTLNGLQFSGTLALKENLLRLDNLHLRQGNTDLLAGYAQLPFEPAKLSAPGGPVPDMDAIDVNVDSKPIPLDTIYRAAFPGQTNSPASGTL
ncbi:MAG: hypothetical protein JO117_10940, partial [Verrucomicrobia bacterium]|nr:hypothetical protein [Verrucomicrobiota bacterium]